MSEGELLQAEASSTESTGTETAETTTETTATETPREITPSEINEKWMTGLPEDLKKDATLSRFKTLEELAKSHRELRAIQGRSISIPGEEATQEELNEFYKKLGRPDNIEGYSLNIPEGLEVQGESVQWFAKTAHELGLNKKAAEQLWDKYLEYTTSTSQELQIDRERQAQKAKEDLMREWGTEFNARVKSAENVFGSLFSEGVRKKLSQAGLTDDLDFIRDLDNLSRQFAEDTSKGTSHSSSVATLDTLRAEREELMKDPDSYWSDPAKIKRSEEIAEEISALQRN